MINKKQTGFTIVELLIVIVVIGILAAIVVVVYNGVRDNAKDTQRKTDLTTISKAMQIWSINSGKSFEELTTGYSGGGATGFFGSGYNGNPSIRQALVNAGQLPTSITDEPDYRYMLTRCTDENDNRRVIMGRLANPPDQTIAEQIQSSNCNNSYINSFASNSSYGMNYAIVVRGR